MEEKKEVKVKLSTIVLTLTVIILAAGWGITYYFGFLNNKTNETEKNTDAKTEQTHHDEKIDNQLFESQFQFTNRSIEIKMNQLLGTVTYTLVDGDLTRRSVTAPEVHEADSFDKTEVIKSKINKKIIGLAKGYPRYLPEVLVKFENGTYGIVTAGDDSIEPLDIKQYMILGNSYGEYTNDSKNAILTIGPTSPANNYGIRIEIEGNDNEFNTGTMNIKLDTVNELIVFPTVSEGAYYTDNVERIKYEINNLKITKINVEFKDGKIIEFLPNNTYGFEGKYGIGDVILDSTRELNKNELDLFEKYLEAPGIWNFISTQYKDLTEFNLSYFLSYYYNSIEATNDQIIDIAGEDGPSVPLHLFPKANIDLYFLQHTGKDVSIIKPEFLPLYSEKYHSYYNRTSDANFMDIDVISGTESGNKYVIKYKHGETSTFELTLNKVNGEYLFVSNVTI